MGSLLEAINAESGTRHKTCGVALVAEKLSKADRATLEDALTKRDERGEFAIPHTTLSRALKKIGVNLSTHSIGRHRLGNCQCGGA